MYRAALLQSIFTYSLVYTLCFLFSAAVIALLLVTFLILITKDARYQHAGQEVHLEKTPITVNSTNIKHLRFVLQNEDSVDRIIKTLNRKTVALSSPEWLQPKRATPPTMKSNTIISNKNQWFKWIKS